MQFEPRESEEERRRRQRDYHSFLDWQVESKKKAKTTDNDVHADRLPSLPFTGRSTHESRRKSYGVHMPHRAVNSERVPDPHLARKVEVDVGGNSDGSVHWAANTAGQDRNDYLRDLEERLEAEVYRRYLVEKKTAVLDQKLDNLMNDSATTLARDAAVREVREQTGNLESELAAVREWRNRVDRSLALAPKMQETIQQQVKSIEEEARTRLQADEARNKRFRQAFERVLDEIQGLTDRISDKENVALRQLAKLEAAFSAEAKGARNATRQLKAQVQEFGVMASEAESRMSSLYQKLGLLEKRQQDQHSAEAAQRAEERVSRQQMQARNNDDDCGVKYRVLPVA